MSAPRHAAEAALVDALARAQALHADRVRDPGLADALDRLAQWQARRLAATYADLAAQPRYAEAIEFFQTDLYGSADYARRDADVARVVPIMVAMLPERVIATIADAMNLNVLSHELDRKVLALLPQPDRYTVAEYCEAYRGAGEFAARERQIVTIGSIGAALDVFVRKPLIRTALSMMRTPSRMAGFGVLHDFLERGFNAFHRMGGADEFLATIAARETAIHRAIVAGASEPFADPSIPVAAGMAGRAGALHDRGHVRYDGASVDRRHCEAARVAKARQSR